MSIIVREEDYLVLLIDSFLDFKDGILLLGYDLRIDAYTYFHLSPPLKKIQLIPGKLYQVKRKVTTTTAHPSSPDLEEVSVEQKLKTVEPNKLNAIEQIYYTNYLNHRKKTPVPTPNSHVMLCIGDIKTLEKRVSVLGPCFDLTVYAYDLGTELPIRMQTNSFEIGDKICFLVRKMPSSQGWSYRILGFKNKQETLEYLNADFRILRNQEINPIDFR